MPRMNKVQEGENGWSEWIAPKHKRYRMGCCDCGLVHDMQFKIVRVTSTRTNGTWLYVPAKGKFRVMFRATRNNRSTAGLRRKKK